MKTNKVHPLTAFRKANEARQAVVKKSMKKFQPGGEKTPFQSYMETPGAVASDTTMTSVPATFNSGNPGFKPSSPKAKNAKNQKALEGAWEKTYGMDYNYDRTIAPYVLKNTTMDKEQRRIGSPKKKGGSVKRKK